MSQTPARAQQPQNGGLHPQVREFMQSASDIYHDHDALIDENTSLRNRAEVAEGLNDHYKSDLKEITADRDYHMRLALALTTRLNAAMERLLRDLMWYVMAMIFVAGAAAVLTPLLGKRDV